MAKKLFFVCVLALFTCSPVWAGINVVPMVIYLNPTQAKKPQDLKVTNSDPQQKAYVTVTPFKVENPGTSREKEIPLTGSEKRELLATPSKLIIPQSEFRKVRLLLTQPTADRDRVYRVLVEPIVTPLKGSGEQVAPGVQMVFAYKVLLVQLPENPEAKILAKREGQQLLIQNEGNTNAVLFHGQVCDSHNKCSDLPVKRLYAGNNWSVNLPQGAVRVHYDVEVADKDAKLDLSTDKKSMALMVKLGI